MTIEIGTSDFRTQAGKVEGIFIEPVKYYFDRLPECNKINCSISNYEGHIDMFYLTDEDITKHNLPQWVRGCNSVNVYHPSVVAALQARKINPHTTFRKDTVPVRRIKSIIDEFKVVEIDHLKIDTEGHDCIILNDFLDTVDILPKAIQFEANVLSDKTEVRRLRFRLEEYGYSTNQVNDDIIAAMKDNRRVPRHPNPPPPPPPQDRILREGRMPRKPFQTNER